MPGALPRTDQEVGFSAFSFSGDRPSETAVGSVRSVAATCSPPNCRRAVVDRHAAEGERGVREQDRGAGLVNLIPPA